VPIEAGEVVVGLEDVASGLTAPLALTHAGDGSGRLFVVDQIGTIRVIKDGQLLATPFLDLGERVVDVNPAYDERGVLGLTFHPEYASNGRFFVRYSAPREGGPEEPCNDPGGFIVGCHKEVLAEFRVSVGDPDVADPDSEATIYEVAEPEFNHNGGDIAFGPDGFLYVPLGDGGGANDGLGSDPPLHGPGGNGQNVETPLGKILRIDVDGMRPFEVPSDNPFVGAEGLDEIYAYGFRNPFKISFDRGGSRELFVGEVGQGLFEEVDVVEKGGNYGWAIREGAHCFDPQNPSTPKDSCLTEGLIDPIAEYDHSEGVSVIGGYVYRGLRIAELRGKYVFGDFSRDFGPTGRLLYLDADGGDRSKIFELGIVPERSPLGLLVRGFGEDEEGDLYVLGSTDLGPTGSSGVVVRIVSATGGGLRLPGDANEDGALDISDAVAVFGVLFTGNPSAFPCGSGLPDDPGNRLLIDWQPDGRVDISDGIALLQFLFQGGPRHSLAVPGGEGSVCVPIAGCAPGMGCP
jgi:glucose/arabinose dehydrogenase